MKYSKFLPRLIHVLALATCTSSTYASDQGGILSLSSSEAEYLGVLRSYEGKIRKEGYVAADKADQQALEALEKKLKDVVGRVEVLGFSASGHINISTLMQGELGYGRADMLRYEGKDEVLYLSTSNLLRSYLAKHKDMPQKFELALNDEGFYTYALSAEADTTFTMPLEVLRRNGQRLAGAWLGLDAQDVGPIIPNNVYVYVVDEPLVFVVVSKEAATITTFPTCQRKWDSAVHLKKEPGDENKAFRMFQNCVKDELGRTEALSVLTRQAQAIVDRVASSRRDALPPNNSLQARRP